MGLNSGEVIVGKIGDDLRMDYTAQGQTVGLAQRMEQLAAGECVYLTEHTAQLVEGYFALRDLGAFDLKGLSDPLHVYDLEGVGTARTRLDVSRSRGLSKFVGRDDEVATLHAALERVREGHGQVVGVVAEAGAGKSRLCFEFLEHCRTQGVPIFEARGVAHGAALPFHPIRELFRSYYGITEQDAPALARQKIAGQLLLIDDAFREILPVIFEFLGVPDPDHRGPTLEPDARNRELRRLMQGVTREDRGGQVTLLEDLHWFDEASLDYLAQLVELSAASGSLILVNFRPEFHAAWMQKSYYQQLPLVPLGPEAIRALLEDVLGPDASVEQLPDIITRRTGGNPFFVEETVQSLIESGHLEGVRGAYRLATPVDRLPLSATVQAVLAARIDRLGEHEKQTLQTAAVLGKEFTEPLLAQVLALSDAERAAALDALKVGEFVYEAALYPVTEYAFKHPLTQEVAYDSQLVETRRPIHAAAAKAIERAHSDELDEHAALVSYHWEGAGELLQAARWSARAAQHAGISASEEADRHWRRVRSFVSRLDATRETRDLMVAACLQILNLGWRLGMEAEDAASVLADGERCARETGDAHARAQLYAIGGGTRGDRPLAYYLDLSGKALDLARTLGDPQLVADATGPRAISLREAGNLEEIILLWDQALQDPDAVGVGLWGLNEYIYGVGDRAWVLGLMGRLVEGEAELGRAEKLARQSDDTECLVQMTRWRALLAYLAGDLAAAQQAERDCLEIAQRRDKGYAMSRIFTLYATGIAALLEAQWERAREALHEVIASGFGAASILASSLLSAAYLGLGDAHAALGCARAAPDRFPDSTLATLAAIRARLKTGQAVDRSEIERELAGARARIVSSGARSLEPIELETRAACAGYEGDTAAQRRGLLEAHRLYSAMGATGHAERVARELESF
jgi:adenylate cyclase